MKASRTIPREWVLPAILATALSAGAATFSVTTTADSGAGSLRQAITQANADTTTPRVINFAIGTGVQTIMLSTPLPEITRTVTLDGTTQPGYAGSPLMVIDGNFVDGDGIAVNYPPTGSDGPVIKALCIVRFGANGGTTRHGIHFIQGDPGSVTGCHLGINAAGTAAARNTGAGIRYALFPAGTPQFLGGTTAAERNVISGNLGAGALIEGNFVTLSGNFIGTSADGLNAVPNGGDGVAASTSTQVKIGTATVGAGNVISGNAGHGVHLTAGAPVQGNLIGLGADGATALGNALDGVFIDNTAATIGGTTDAGRNVISGNTGRGVRVAGPAASSSTLQRNFIGTDVTGMLARGNGSHGIDVTAGKASISTSVISGNTGSGVRLAAGISPSNSSTVSNNKIGVTTDATAKIGNGGDGITVANAPTGNLSNNTIGGNTGSGIAMSGANAHDIFITSNFIGTSAGGTANLGNSSDGIALTGGALNDIIGANTFASGANIIAYNGGAGVKLASAQHDVRVNSIYANTGLAIDAPVGSPTVNPPFITTPVIDGTDLAVTLTHDASANTNYRYRIYGNDVPDAAGGEMQMFVGVVNGTTDGNGHFETTVTFPGAAFRRALREDEPTDPSKKKPGAGDSVCATATTNKPGSPPNNEQTKCGGNGQIAGGQTGGGNTNTAANKISSGKSNDPINTFTGELFDVEALDLNLRGPMPLSFGRYYASMIESDGHIASALGRNRLHNFDAKLTVVGTEATAVLHTGRVMQFTKVENAWRLDGPLDVPFQLVESAGGLILADPRDQRMRTFDATGKLTKIEDGRGNAHTLTYDANSRLSGVSDGLGRAFAFTYGGDGHLSRVSDGTRRVDFTYTGSDLVTAANTLGNTTTFTYDASGRLLSTTRPRGNAPYSQTYDASARVATQTEHLASGDQTTGLAYDTNTHATTITDPTTKTRVHTHTATGELTGFTDEEKKAVTMTYDANGRRSSVIDRLGRTTLITYHAPSGKPSSLTAPNDAVTSFGYSPRVINGITFFDLTTISFPDGASRTFAYDAGGNVVSATDQVGNTSSFTYDAHGRVLTVTNPTGGVAAFTYTPATETLRTSKDSDTGETTYTYDAFSRLTRIAHPDTTHIDITYDGADRVTSITDERGKSFAFSYDENDNVTTVTDPASENWQVSYDALDRVMQFTDRLGKVSRRTFDSRGWVAAVTNQLAHTTVLAHDTRQRLASLTNPGSATTAFGYNDEAELTAITDPLAHTRTFTRNPRGRVISTSDALGHTTQLVRDSVDRVTMSIDPIGRQSALTHDKRSLLMGAAAGGMGGATYTRDAAGRLVKITDPNSAAWSFSYSLSGRLRSSTDPLGNTTSLGHDTRGRLATSTGPEGGIGAITRDEAGNVTRLGYTGGPVLDYTYDALGQLTSATGVVLTRDAEGRITGSQQAGVNFSGAYDDAGRLITLGYNNTVFVVTYAYDTRNRLTTVSDNHSNSVAFTYDVADRVTAIARSNGVTATLSYDAADRLTRIQDGSFLDLKYTRNAAGDITATDMTAPLLPGAGAATKQFQYDAASQVRTAGFTYDTRGRVTAMPGHAIAWDGASRLTAIDGSTLAYDGFNDVTTRTVGSVTTRLFYHHAVAGHRLVAERVETAGAFTRFYVWTPGGTLLFSADSTNGTPRFYHYDQSGSTLALTDGSGSVTDSYAYSPYGESLGHHGPSTQPFKFIGAFGIRAEGDFYQMGARYYDPQTARFLSRDPAAPRLEDVRTLNPYAYALENPTRYVDVNGAAPAIQNVYGRSGDEASGNDVQAAVAALLFVFAPGENLGALAEQAMKRDESGLAPKHIIGGLTTNALIAFNAKTTPAADGSADKASINAAEEAVMDVVRPRPRLFPLANAGFEEMFHDGPRGFDLRLPFLQNPASANGLGDLTVITGDLRVIMKYGLLNDRDAGSGPPGLSVTVPSGPAQRGQAPVPPGPLPFISESNFHVDFRY